MENLISKIMLTDIPSKVEMNPFIQRIIDIMYKTKRLKKNTLRELNSELEGGDFLEILSEPEDLLDFDVSLFPDKLDILVVFKDRLDKGSGVCGLRRLGNKLYFSPSFSLDEGEYYKTPINLLRLQWLMHREAKNYGFMVDKLSSSLESVLFTAYYFTVPAKGNMLGRFNEAYRAFEKLYTKAKRQVIKEAKTFK